MANLASLEAARNTLLADLDQVNQQLAADRQALAHQEANLQFATTEQQATAIRGSISTLKREIAQGVNEQARLVQELTDINQQIALFQIQQGPRTSAGEVVAQAQRANDDRADTISPPEPPPITAGAGVTNADQFQIDQATDTGTNAPTRPTTVTQSIPPITARPGAARQTIAPPNFPGQVTVDPFGGFPDDAAVNATSRSGTATNEDGIANSNPTRAALNQIFSGKINPQTNVLDQYASYTYSISIYLMNANDYKTLIQNPNALPKGAQLILQSGGAPVAGGALPVVDVQEVQQAADGNGTPLVLPELGRNPNFPLDYYLDDVRLTSFVNGKATGMAHNVFEVKFKVIEPNGITFLDNLYKATDQYVKLSGTPQVNYAAQNYLMVIRFYGYDKDGNLVTAQNQTTDVLNINTLQTEQRSVSIEKFIPFQFTRIRFRVANKMVEYDCEAVAIQNNVAMGTARGTIPYNVELTSQSLISLLQGKQVFSAASNDAGRPLNTVPDQTDAETARLNRQNAAAARSGVAQSNISSATWAARQEAAAATVQQARRDQLGVPDNSPINAGTGPTQNQAPPKVSAQNSKTLVTGLVDALNSAQDEWVKKGTYTYADRYFIELDPILAEAKVVPPGSTNLRMTPMGPNENARDKLLERTQAVDSNAKKFSILAGTSVVKFLDEVVRNSTYIYDQQIKYYDPKTNELIDVGKPANVTGWYKISMQAVPQGADKYDPKRNDYAYDITYKIEIYGINDAKSPFFPGTIYRGTHKVYDYWFTGINTQVLDYQQDFNYLYYIVQNSRAPDRTRLTTNYREVPRLVAQPRSDQSDQMNEGTVSEPSAQLADYLYSPGDTARVKLRILGDPAWIQQGDVRGGLIPGSQLYDSFLPDGTINYNGQEVLFEVLWNKPVDYDLESGLMDTGAKNYNADRKAGQPGQAVQTNVYKAISVISNFTRGRFEQELEGVQIYYELPGPKQQQQEKQEKTVQAKATDYRNPLVDIPSASPGLFELEGGAGGEVNFKPTGLSQVLDAQKQARGTVAPQTPMVPNPTTAPTSFGQTVGPANSPGQAKISTTRDPRTVSPTNAAPQKMAKEP